MGWIFTRSARPVLRLSLDRNNGPQCGIPCRRDAIGAAVWLFSIQPFATMPATVCFPTGCSLSEGQPSRVAHFLQCSSLNVVGNVLGARRHYFPFAFRSVLRLLSTDAPVRFKLLAIIRNVSPLAFRSRRRSSSSDVHFLAGLLRCPSGRFIAATTGYRSMRASITEKQLLPPGTLAFRKVPTRREAT
jgi:hypothetical protein